MKIEQYPIYKDTYRLSIEITKSMKHIPVDLRKTLGAQVVNTALETLSAMHSAYGALGNDKIHHFNQMQVKIDTLQTFLRMVNEQKMMPFNKVVNLIEQVGKVSNQLAAWRKSVIARA